MSRRDPFLVRLCLFALALAVSASLVCLQRRGERHAAPAPVPSAGATSGAERP